MRQHVQSRTHAQQALTVHLEDVVRMKCQWDLTVGTFDYPQGIKVNRKLWKEKAAHDTSFRQAQKAA